MAARSLSSRWVEHAARAHPLGGPLKEGHPVQLGLRGLLQIRRQLLIEGAEGGALPPQPLLHRLQHRHRQPLGLAGGLRLPGRVFGGLGRLGLGHRGGVLALWGSSLPSLSSHFSGMAR